MSYVLKFRILLLILAVVFYAVLHTPSFSDLKVSDGTLTSMRQKGLGYDIQFTLVEGPVVGTYCKMGRVTCPVSQYQALQQSHESLKIWHDQKKVWQIENAAHQIVVDYKALTHSRNIIMYLALAFFTGLFVCAAHIPVGRTNRAF